MFVSGYVELHCHSAYSFRDGASLPDELAAAAVRLGHHALALTDHDGLHGAMELANAVAEAGLPLRPIIGAELTLEDGSHLTLVAATRAGYSNLCRLITAAHAATRPKPGREPLAPSTAYADLARHADGLICLSGCASRGAVARAVEGGRHADAAAAARRLLAIFGAERLRIELQRPYGRHDRRRNRLLAQLAERLGLRCVATGNVHAHDRSRAALQDALVAVRLGRTLDECESARRGNHAHVLATPAGMAERFADHPEAVAETARVAAMVEFDLRRDLAYSYPRQGDPDADRELAAACRARLDDRYPHRSGLRLRADAEARLDEELAVIRHLGLSGFFLLHRDMLELAREVAAEVRGPDTVRALLPPGRGRGSSVSSLVCYLTGLSHVDPVANDLHLGRFLNDELTAVPDIDLDFPRDIRERLIPRVHERYGHDRSALVASFPTYQARSAVRDFAKALGLPPAEVERLARTVDPWRAGNDIAPDVRAARAIDGGAPRWRALVELVAAARRLPRHMSQHPGGMVVSGSPLTDLCPIQPAAMEGRQMVQWDKDSCADAGFLKIDLLGLGMLSCVERCVEEIARVRGERIDLSRIDFADRAVYREIQAAETMGVFQIESRAQMQMLKRTRPENLDDLTVQVALVRPGPILGGAVHPYIERRRRLREDPGYQIPYEHPSLEPALRDTLGAIVFQDQVIEVAMAFAGYSAGEAEGLRRAMSRRRSEEAMREHERRFVEGAVARGVERPVAERVYDQIVGFSGFGFPKSHSAAFGLLAYQSTWLRVHYAPEFLAALLNEQPMGFYPPDSLVHEAQRRGLGILGPCVERSGVECRVERLGGEVLGVRIGLGYVNGVREEEVEALVAERERGGGWRSVADLAARSGAGAATLERLAWAGACDGLVEGPAQLRRRLALWDLGVAVPAAGLGEAGDQLALPLEPHAGPELPELTAWQRLLADYGSTGMTLHEHPLELMRGALPAGTVSSAELERLAHGTRVRVAGLVVARQRPETAKGVTFMLLEDEHGTANLIIPPAVHDERRLVVRGEPLVLADGRLERRDGVVNVLVSDIHRLERTDLPRADVVDLDGRRDRQVAGRPGAEEEAVAAGGATLAATRAAESELRAVAPAGHRFGRRG
ncbi:MAG: error-prone DNA polymerase [Solirubrobacterales bacterium]|nr:error-prone DNA polymerase [Solirubrobacterales bacterium]